MIGAIAHDHREVIRGAQATAPAVLLVRTRRGKQQIRADISAPFRNDLDKTIDGIRPDYRFDVSYQGTVPAAIVAFLDSSSFEDAVRNANSLGGDSDTLACIAGGIAEAYHAGVPEDIRERAMGSLPADLREITERFDPKYPMMVSAG